MVVVSVVPLLFVAIAVAVAANYKKHYCCCCITATTYFVILIKMSLPSKAYYYVPGGTA